MVTVVDYAARKNGEGKDFFALILQGGIEMVMSKQTGRYYATAKRTSIPSTFDELTCRSLVGEKIPGTIMKVPCDSYSFAVKETGEIIEMNHRWVYLPEEASQPVFQGRVVEPLQVPVF